MRSCRHSGSWVFAWVVVTELSSQRVLGLLMGCRHGVVVTAGLVGLCGVEYSGVRLFLVGRYFIG